MPRILEANPQARLIVSLRDPIDQIASVHARWRAAGVEQLDLESALRYEGERPTWSTPTRLPILGGAPRYRSVARFGEQLERLFRVAPREQVLVVKLDDIRADPLALITHVSGFLGTPAPTELGMTRRNASREPRSRLLLESVWSRHTIGFVKAIVPRRLHERARRLSEAGLDWNRRDVPLPAVPAQVRRMLEAELRPDLELASRLVGEDLVSRWWGAAT